MEKTPLINVIKGIVHIIRTYSHDFDATYTANITRFAKFNDVYIRLQMTASITSTVDCFANSKVINICLYSSSLNVWNTADMQTGCLMTI